MKSAAFTLGGLLLLAWAAVNTYLDVTRYGTTWGAYWWFCNLATFGIGIGLLIRSRGLLTGFVAIASFTQSLWILDNVMTQWYGQGPIGLVGFMYRPGYPMDEFVLTHYHYFTIPIALMGILFLPKRNDYTVRYIAVFNPLIFAVSYFAFSSEQNINCIHRACFSGMSTWDGPIYSIAFWAVVYALHLIIGAGLVRFFAKVDMTPARQNLALAGFLATMVAAVGLTVKDVNFKQAMPQFACSEPASEGGVTSGCQFTRLHYEGQFTLTYFLKNEGDALVHCQVSLRTADGVTSLNEGTTVEARAEVHLSAALPTPTKDTKATVVTHCSPLTTLSAN